jgi:subtilisin family serine protease
MRRAFVVLLAVSLLMVSSISLAAAAQGNRNIGINVVLRQDISAAILADLGRYGTVNETYPQIDALTMKVRESALGTIQALPYVAAANPDAKRVGKPVPSSPFDDSVDGITAWDMDIIDVMDNAPDQRTVAQDGTGVYVAVLDTGLLSSWRFYFGEERIADEFGIAFGGGGGERGSVSTQPNKWQTDQNSHGTHVTSTILGYNFLNQAKVGGVAPRATVIPVKVLNNNGSGWSSMVAAGINYVTDLKLSGALNGAPVVINMSLGGDVLDAMEAAAINRAIANGVLIVASAGNEGTAGMGYPGAYEPVISVAAAGWVGEWQPGGDGIPNNFWNADNVPDPTNAMTDAYITDFSSRQLTGQDLDLAAPGSWVVGPYQVNGQLSYFFLGGTSMASPHVAGTVALMLQKNPGLSQAGADAALTGSALDMGTGCRNVIPVPGAAAAPICWETGADSNEATGAGLLNVPGALAATPLRFLDRRSTAPAPAGAFVMPAELRG